MLVVRVPLGVVVVAVGVGGFCPPPHGGGVGAMRSLGVRPLPPFSCRCVVSVWARLACPSSPRRSFLWGVICTLVSRVYVVRLVSLRRVVGFDSR